MSKTKTTLGRISEIITGPFGSALHMSDYVEVGNPVIMPQNIGNRIVDESGIARITDDDFERLNRYATKKNDLVFSRRGDVEKHAFITNDSKMLCGTGCLRVRVNCKDVSPLYLSFFLSKPETRKWLSTHAVGSNMLNLNTDILSAVPVELPSYDEQIRVATALQLIDERVINNNKINDNLQQMAKTIYNYWFTQFDFPNEDGNPYRSSGGQMVWDEIAKRKIPVGWRCSKMEETIDSIRTGLNPRDNFKLNGGNIKYVTVKNLRSDGVLDFAGCDTIDEEARQIVHRRSDVSVGDILFASIAPLGRCYLVQEAPEDWDINESVFSIRCNKDSVTSEYLYMHLQSEAFVKESTACSTGSIFKGIRINSLMDSKIIIPPLSVIRSFSKEVQSIFALQSKLNNETSDLIKLRDWLLPMLMNGQAAVEN